MSNISRTFPDQGTPLADDDQQIASIGDVLDGLEPKLKELIARIE